MSKASTGELDGDLDEFIGDKATSATAAPTSATSGKAVSTGDTAPKGGTSSSDSTGSSPGIMDSLTKKTGRIIMRTIDMIGQKTAGGIFTVFFVVFIAWLASDSEGGAAAPAELKWSFTLNLDDIEAIESEKAINITMSKANPYDLQKERPLTIVSVVGDTRSGKTWLINKQFNRDFPEMHEPEQPEKHGLSMLLTDKKQLVVKMLGSGRSSDKGVTSEKDSAVRLTEQANLESWRYMLVEEISDVIIFVFSEFDTHSFFCNYGRIPDLLSRAKEAAPKIVAVFNIKDKKDKEPVKKFSKARETVSNLVFDGEAPTISDDQERRPMVFNAVYPGSDTPVIHIGFASTLLAETVYTPLNKQGSSAVQSLLHTARSRTTKTSKVLQQAMKNTLHVYFEGKNKDVNITLQSGEIGIEFSEGKVTEVFQGTQAERQGIQVGWRLIAIDNQPCHDFSSKVSQDARAGSSSNKVTFVKDDGISRPLKEENFDTSMTNAKLTISTKPTSFQFESLVLKSAPENRTDRNCRTQIRDISLPANREFDEIPLENDGEYQTARGRTRKQLQFKLPGISLDDIKLVHVDGDVFLEAAERSKRDRHPHQNPIRPCITKEHAYPAVFQSGLSRMMLDIGSRFKIKGDGMQSLSSDKGILTVNAEPI